MGNFWQKALGWLLALTFCTSHVLAAPSAGCGKTPSAMTNGTKSITVGSKTRQFIVRLPTNYDKNRPYRLVFTFHPLGGSMTQIAQGDRSTLAYYGLPPLANNSAIFVSPNGETGSGGPGGGNLMGWANRGGDDVRFVDAMVAALDADLCIESTLRFATGFSYGGGMSYALACARPDAFRAVAILSGAVLSGCEGGTRPIAYYQQHGTEDNVLPISGTRAMRDRFLANNGCAPATGAEPQPRADGGPTRVDYTGCRAGLPVSYVVFRGGHTPSQTEPGKSTPFAAPNSWNFFSQFA